MRRPRCCGTRPVTCLVTLGGVAAALLGACVGDEGPPDGIAEEVRAKAPAELWDALSAGEDLSFIVALGADAGQGGIGTAALPTFSVQRVAWAEAKLRTLADASDALAVEAAWDQLPLMQVRARSLEAAVQLLGHADVTGAYVIETYALTDAESFPLIGQPLAQAGGFVGAGTSVAVLDTGADFTRADLGSCTSPGVPSGCRVAYAQDFAANDNNVDDHGHGTNVSGITAGTAPGTRILALDVFTGGSAYSNHIIDAINWSIANKAAYDIAAMNLSLGGGSASAPCSNDAMGIALGTARAAGIAPVVASGNNAFTNMLASPACAPAAISVGAVYDSNVGAAGYGACSDATTAADKVTCFSNSASFLTLLAPGARIAAAGITMSGTSQAAPHVAGAFAVLRAAYPAESVDQLLGRLTSTGTLVTDARNSVVKPRIDLYRAVGAPAVDVTAPTGSVVIDGGASHARTAAVTLTIAGVDDRGVQQICISNTTACTAWTTYATTRAWTLAPGDGVKTVTVFLRDAAGNATTLATAAKDTIILDATPPVNGTVAATPGDGVLTLAWAGFADAASGVAGYKVVVATAAVAPATCTGLAVYEGAGLAFTHTGRVNGTTYAYRVCAIDAAGNLSTGATVVARSLPEATPPVGTVAINAGAAITRALAVTLTLAATDASTVTSMCIAEVAPCTAWVPYATTRAYSFAAGDRVRTVMVWFKDAWGNVSLPASASILLDATAPTPGALVAAPGTDRVALAWSGAADATTGVGSYKLVVLTGATAPAAGCTTGVVLYAGGATSFAHTGVVNGTQYQYRLCPIDVAGNVSAGATATARLLPETTPPAGTLAINGGAATTRLLAVTLTLAATDASGVTTMCISEGATCTTYVPYATTRAYTFAAGDRVRPISVWFRDAWGNTSPPVTASILLDTTAPTPGTLVAAPVAGAVALAWAGATDAGAGIAGYRLVGLTGTTPPAAACATGAVLYEGLDRTFTHTGLVDGTSYAYRVCPIDAAGNVSAGAVATAVLVPEVTPPVGTLAIAGGAAATRSLAVTLTLSATDASGVASMCIAEGTACTVFAPYATSKLFTLAAGDRVRSISVWFRDVWGNTSAPVTASILLDTTAPAQGALVASPAAGATALTWTPAIDAGVGVASYKLVALAGATPPAATCTTGTVLYAGPETAFTHSGLVDGAPWSYRLCALDALGNVSAGVTTTAAARPELVAPTGTLAIDGGAPMTRSLAVTLTLGATDASGVTSMCVGEAATCTTWVPFATSRAYTFAAGDRVRTVAAWYRDAWGNVSAPVSASILLDATAPTGGALASTGVSGGVALVWSAATDATSGLAGYKLVGQAGTLAPASCALGATLYAGAGSAYTHTLATGTTWSYRLCAIDVAGNVSAGTTRTQAAL